MFVLSAPAEVPIREQKASLAGTSGRLHVNLPVSVRETIDLLRGEFVVPRYAILFGLLLILLGLGSYFGTGRASVTALIPAFFGLPLLLTGLLGLRENLRQHAMHAAAVLALLGLLGTASGIPKFAVLLAGGTVERPAAAVVQTLMVVLCAVFVSLCVHSFISARRRRAARIADSAPQNAATPA